jgi:signal transduction histidine kinase
MPNSGLRVALGVIGVALAGLLVAFALSLGAASRRFEHALIAQQQQALVADIARDADTRGAGALAQSLTTYRDLIAAEGNWLSPAEREGQDAEMRRADQLAAMAHVPAERARLAAMVKAIAADEAIEVAHARADLDHERHEAIALAVLLALAAMGAALWGARQLVGANRILTAELAERRAELAAVDASRRLFFAKASHELRTPVTAIRTLAEVALERCVADPGFGDIVAQAGFLDHRIAEMLALAQADDTPRLALAPGDLAEAIDGAVAQAGAYARAIEVAIDWPRPAEPVPVTLDRRWMGQAILTVIDNGLKFSDPGGVLAIACTRAGDRVVVTVTDRGPGVLPHDLPRIFDAYYQADAGRLRGGTGLGLALARWVVEAHGGTIHAENQEVGCRIVIEMPL